MTAGSVITVHYDPMVSKLIAWGDDRAQALARMRRALDEYRVGGIKTNLPFHRRLLRHPRFVGGEYDTGFIDREKAVLLAPYAPSDEEVDTALIAAAVHSFSATPAARGEATSVPASVAPSPWRFGRSPWRH